MTLTNQLKQFRDATMMRMPRSIIQTFEDSLSEIARDGLKNKALQIGDTLPKIILTDNLGGTIKLEDVHQLDYLVLNFYRGGWCPYCNMELRAYESLKNEFADANASIIAISAEVPDLAAKTSQKNAITFPVLTDRDAKFMKEVGIVFRLNEKMKQDYEGFGMDLTQIHGNENYELPVPAVYVINKNREIIFVHFEADYMTRIEPEQILTIIKQQN